MRAAGGLRTDLGMRPPRHPHVARCHRSGRPTTALGVPGVLHVSAEKRFQFLKPDFTASPLMKLDVNGVFELLSVRAVHWYACHLPKVKLQKLRSEKHAFGLPVERRKEGSQGP